jgi:predicted extracellular nuclease
MPGDKVRIVGTVGEFSGLTQHHRNKVEVVEAGAVADVNSLAVDIELPRQSGGP